MSRVVQRKDLAIFVCFVVLRNRSILGQILQYYDIEFFSRLVQIIGTVAIIIQARRYWNDSGEISKSPSKAKIKDITPRLYPARTNHTRLFPKVHSFSYSYLLTGVPIGWKGSIGRILAIDRHLVQGSVRTLYEVNSADYLDRGFEHLGLEGKLQKYLMSQVFHEFLFACICSTTNFNEVQGIKPAEYPFAYLVTAPRFLGYSFNPVSFWYLYSSQGDLSAMILEVNNTFDERRMYFLSNKDNSKQDHGQLGKDGEKKGEVNCGLGPPDDQVCLPGSSGSHESRVKFLRSWPKDFHVSPFNSRKGSYSLVAYDPLSPSVTGLGAINNTITLKSSKEHPKLVARIFSQGSSVDPESMTFTEKTVFLASWWWVGLVTFPRIVWEAGKLFFNQKLHVWFRPEPLKRTIGRSATRAEQNLEACFRVYLRALVKSHSSAMTVKYTASGISKRPEETMKSNAADIISGISSTLEIKVLTPVFYTRFIHYTHDLDAFSHEFSQDRTIWLSQPSLIVDLLQQPQHEPFKHRNWNILVWSKLLQILREKVSPIETHDPSSKTKSRNVTRDIQNPPISSREAQISAMDLYFLATSRGEDRRAYCREVLKVFISDRIAFGEVAYLHAEILLVKCVILWWAAGKFKALL